VRGEVSILPSLYNIVFTKQRDGAPVEIIFAPEGMPIILCCRHYGPQRRTQRRQLFRTGACRSKDRPS